MASIGKALSDETGRCTQGAAVGGKGAVGKHYSPTYSRLMRYRANGNLAMAKETLLGLTVFAYQA